MRLIYMRPECSTKIAVCPLSCPAGKEPAGLPCVCVACASQFYKKLTDGSKCQPCVSICPEGQVLIGACVNGTTTPMCSFPAVFFQVGVFMQAKNG